MVSLVFPFESFNLPPYSVDSCGLNKEAFSLELKIDNIHNLCFFLSAINTSDVSYIKTFNE